MNFRPNKKKVFGALIISIIINWISWWVLPVCCSENGCRNCGFFGFISAVLELPGAFIVIVTLVLVYVIWSLIEKNEKKK